MTPETLLAPPPGRGRPSKAALFRNPIAAVLQEEPELLSLEIVRRMRLQGYDGQKSAMYALIASLRPASVRPMVRFEGVAGEFAQHDFGQVDVRFRNGAVKRIHFFASRLKYSRDARVTLVENEQVEALVRAQMGHYAAWGGVPLLSVYDRPKTVALKWKKDGTVTEWNSTFAGVMLELGVGIELCWPARGQEKGSVENLVGWHAGATGKPSRNGGTKRIELQAGLLLLVFQQAQTGPYDFAGVVVSAGFHLLADEVFEVGTQGDARRHDDFPKSC